jgi:hypothetical protein
MTADPVSAAVVVDWIANHLQLVGWPALVGITWKFKGLFDRHFNSLAEVKENAVSAVQTTKQIKQNLEVVQNNHLAHLADDIKQVGIQYEKHTELLTSIDRGIAVLVDRSSSKRGK